VLRPRLACLALAIFLAACNGTVPITAGSNATGTPSAGGSPATPGSGTATLSWVAPSTTTTGARLIDLAGYRVYYGMNATSLDHMVLIPGSSITTTVIEQLAPGMWYFATTAVDSRGLESAFSNIAQKTIG
jgi:hypothetical protein